MGNMEWKENGLHKAQSQSGQLKFRINDKFCYLFFYIMLLNCLFITILPPLPSPSHHKITPILHFNSFLSSPLNVLTR